ncbi:TniQ family protein [Nocardia africana]|uniref:Transposase and inactivated derivatives n=1 Tax=Nocardia africana TaxID=134964 RepID=A0A379X5I5_9NOCA|nr:TniQ family protein [Nocardia africana]MCC3316330.1 TniQ family protein [Nocardia africana]MCC3318301.1 TniQ family protein [Nocardia africana]MCC3318442.1 TniQ family protein [Nocardia africana]SUA41320.1 Transposase and inactivated derivatives [Nocardia africana]SUA47363.1 Transposase and inactivated derivatives [Nocardia africana]
MTPGTATTPLPVRLRPEPGETAESFVIRLAIANHLRPSYLRRYVTPGRYGTGCIEPAKLAAVSGRTLPALMRMFPELAERRRPKRQGTTQARREAKQRNDSIKQALYVIIRRDADKGLSGREIQRKHNVGYRTVRAALTLDAPPPRKNYPARERTSLQHLIPDITAILDVTPDATVQDIWNQLLDQHHAEISYSALRQYLADLRGPSPRRRRNANSAHLQ